MAQAVPVASMIVPGSDRRLIEDYLPLDALNAISTRGKKHPKHPVALVRYWLTRRLTTVSRTAVHAALAPAPNSGDKYADAASFVAKLAVFKPDPGIVAEADDRIGKVHGDRTPKVSDLSAGRGALGSKPKRRTSQAGPVRGRGRDSIGSRTPRLREPRPRRTIPDTSNRMNEGSGDQTGCA